MTHAAPMNADRWNALQDRVVELEARVEELVRERHKCFLRWDGGWFADCCPVWSEESSDYGDYSQNDALAVARLVEQEHAAHVASETAKALA